MGIITIFSLNVEEAILKGFTTEYSFPVQNLVCVCGMRRCACMCVCKYAEEVGCTKCIVVPQFFLDLYMDVC